MITPALYQNIAVAISAYIREAYTTARGLSGTGIVGGDAAIDVTGEGVIGQLRWQKPLNPVINTGSITNSADGATTDVSTALATFIKLVRTSGARQINLTSLVSKADGIQTLATDYMQIQNVGEVRDMMAILRGLIAAEVAKGNGLNTYSDDPAQGMYVDLNAAGVFGSAVGTGAGRKLFDPTDSAASRGQRLLNVVGMAWQDLEPDYCYLVVDPQTMADIRSCNLVDTVPIVEGNISFTTIMGGKFRLVNTRADKGNLSAHENVNDASTRTTVLMKPNAFAMKPIPLPKPIGIEVKESSYGGTGETSMWFRWGSVIHPWGYDYAGPTTDFPGVNELAAATSWERKVDPLNTAFVPVLHS